MENNPEAQKAFKQNDWNHYRIEAIGDTIKTWINSVPASYLIDDKTASGFIGLQVHSIKDHQKEGTDIIWKNIKILTDSLEKYTTKSTLTPVVTKNNLTIDEAKKGWKLLWDGKTTQKLATELQVNEIIIFPNEPRHSYQITKIECTDDNYPFIIFDLKFHSSIDSSRPEEETVRHSSYRTYWKIVLTQ